MKDKTDGNGWVAPQRHGRRRPYLGVEKEGQERTRRGRDWTGLDYTVLHWTELDWSGTDYEPPPPLFTSMGPTDPRARPFQ
jgi:hypothetical protein